MDMESGVYHLSLNTGVREDMEGSFSLEFLELLSSGEESSVFSEPLGSTENELEITLDIQNGFLSFNGILYDLELNSGEDEDLPMTEGFVLGFVNDLDGTVTIDDVLVYKEPLPVIEPLLSVSLPVSPESTVKTVEPENSLTETPEKEFYHEPEDETVNEGLQIINVD